MDAQAGASARALADLLEGQQRSTCQVVKPDVAEVGAAAVLLALLAARAAERELR
ncbi:MAG TPA: hypothetical protein VKT77_02895 [Chthonomonadaceae bacterium]|nr:hypothetical protein [Chthonomonadaceae bacterium]